MGDGTVKYAGYKRGIGGGGMRNKRKKKTRLIREAEERVTALKIRDKEMRDNQYADEWGGYMDDNRDNRGSY